MRSADNQPTVADLAKAVQRPARPLFLGRKPCLPAAPLFAGLVQAETLIAALVAAPFDPGRARLGIWRAVPTHLQAWWPAEEAHPQGDRHVQEHYVTEERDWRNQIHVGERRILHGRIALGDQP